MNRYIALKRIVELGGFSRAAEELGYTQPALSHMIASLEKELSFQLLHRSRHGVSLTPEGQRLFPSILNTVAQYESLQEIVKEIHGLDYGTIRIGTVSSVSVHWLPDLIKKFKEEYPNVRFTLLQGDWKIIAEWVNTRNVDFGFVNPEAISGMRTHFIKEDELVAVVPTSSPLAKKASVTLEELTKEQFLLLEEGSLNEPMEAFKKANLTPNISLVAHDDYSIMMMIEKGLGVSILPELVTRRTNYKVEIRPITPIIKRSLGIVMPEKHLVPIASQRFIQFVLDNAKNLI